MENENWKGQDASFNDALRHEKCHHCHTDVYTEYLASRSKEREVYDEECDGPVHPWCIHIPHPRYLCHACGLSDRTMRALVDHIASNESCSTFYCTYLGPRGL